MDRSGQHLALRFSWRGSDSLTISALLPEMLRRRAPLSKTEEGPAGCGRLGLSSIAAAVLAGSSESSPASESLSSGVTCSRSLSMGLLFWYAVSETQPDRQTGEVNVKGCVFAYCKDE
jgi:hypothetical protein